MTILNAKVLPKAGHNKASFVSEKKIELIRLKEMARKFMAQFARR